MTSRGPGDWSVSGPYWAFAATAVLLATGGCGGDGGDSSGGSAETIAPITFVETYTDLRMAALQTRGTLDEDRRQSILDRHGVTEEDLREFVEHHGTDPETMRDVWATVDQKLDSARRAAGDREPEELEGDPGGGPGRGPTGDGPGG